MFLGVQEEKQPAAWNMRSSSADISNKEEVLIENYNDLLYQPMVEASIASIKETFDGLLNVSSLLKKKRYGAQVALRLRHFPWKIA